MLQLSSLLVMLAAGQSLPPWLTGESRAEDLGISLITFSPGDDVPSWWGHTALTVDDHRLDQGRLYNFGVFPDGDPLALAKMFAGGRLAFSVADWNIAGTYELYRQANRDVRVQNLDLSPDEALAVAKAVATQALPENRSYRYRYYEDNCATRPRDILDRVLGGQLAAAATGPGRMSFRRHVARYAAVNAPMRLLLDFLQNDSIDGPLTRARETFLPAELEAQVQRLEVMRVGGSRRPLVKKQWVWFAAKRAPVPEDTASLVPATLALGVLLGGLAFWLTRRSREGVKAARLALSVFIATWGALLGVLGTGLGVMALATSHEGTFHNENLLFVNPVMLLLVPAGLALARNRPEAPSRLLLLFQILSAGAALDVLLKVTPWFDQDNWSVLALVLPVNVALVAALAMGGRANAAAASTVRGA